MVTLYCCLPSVILALSYIWSRAANVPGRRLLLVAVSYGWRLMAPQQ